MSGAAVSTLCFTCRGLFFDPPIKISLQMMPGDQKLRGRLPLVKADSLVIRG